MSEYLNHIFDVKANNSNQQHLRGFLDIKSKEIVIYDDYNGRELFRIGNQKSAGNNFYEQPQEQYQKALISLEIKNATNSTQTAILFAANREPLIQPLGVTVVVKEIQSIIFDSHNYLRRNILSSPIKIEGMKYFVQDPSQFNNVIQFGYIPPNSGEMKFYDFQPQSFLGLTQNYKTMIEVPKFRGTVDSNVQISVPVNPKSTCILQFTAYFKKQNGSYQRRSIYSPASFQAFPADDTNSSMSGNVGGSDVKKSNAGKILLTAGIIGLMAANIYLILKSEGVIGKRTI